MKKFITILFILALGFNIHSSFSIDTVAAKYYPLAVGNTWTYSGFGYPCCGAYKYREKITGTIITNGHFYYILTKTQSNGGSEIIYIRVDSLKGNILVNQGSSCPWLQNERTKDSLSARKGDSSKYDCGYYYRCTDTSTGSVFGLNLKEKIFGWSDYFEAGTSRTFAMGIGLVSISSFGNTSTSYVNLTGCYVNGVLHGDTTLTSVNIISNDIPSSFSLSQNYPNPFNPVTNIGFQIAEYGLVKLTVFDAIGKEVEVLVNRDLQAGSYEADWDASAYPSGVYYYKLETEDYSETKKMVLIK